MKKPFYLALFLLFTLAANPTNAAYNLRWDASPGVVDGYQVHYGAEQGVHPYSVDVGNVTEYPLDLLPLDGGVGYYFVVTAYNLVGESSPSNEVYWVTEEAPAAQPDDGAVGDDDGGIADPPTDVATDDGEAEPPSSEVGDADAPPEGTADDGGTGGGEETYLPAEIVIDNGEAGTSSSGIWRLSSGLDAYGGASLYNYLSGSYVYETALNGLFGVSLWWSAHSNRCGSVPVSVYDEEGLLETVWIDQTIGGGRWNPIGTYAFNGTGKIVIESSGWCATCADAARFLEQEGGDSDPPPETVEEDADEALPASDDGDDDPSTLPWTSWWSTFLYR